MKELIESIENKIKKTEKLLENLNKDLKEEIDLEEPSFEIINYLMLFIEYNKGCDYAFSKILEEIKEKHKGE